MCLLLMQSSPVVDLTEAEIEYGVSAVKHVYPKHVVFQFNCTNTIKEQVLEQVMSPALFCLVS